MAFSSRIAVVTIVALMQINAAYSQISTSPPAVLSSKAITLTDQEAKDWINKRVYSGDGKLVGAVDGLTRDSAGRVIDMHTSFGGFLGFGKSRVRLTPNDFALTDGNVILYITAAEARALPLQP
jgi:hypothetical protein